ncbi:MAG TPA: BrnT family toxin [Xanthobacteraceae bacterium]|jgi:uncharacterized DUF497 family protein|nr:BrnT family toxin [Xanthobacteraceae bacterium]
MLDLSQTIGFDWDEANSGKSASKHSLSRAEAEQIFFDEQLLLADDVKHSQDEPRYHALGQTIEGRLLHVTFTLRDNQTRIRVISARDANRRERAAYAQKA